ncbi:hypothetical protein AVL59_15740 [Streptomyces griseochromogenes]|uniref:Uncharacterized protein n=1 Tax=Streptomyces griseochromogenes TaxID=68214 RepID=A0A1B1AWC2_9ACTN|nr:hypothetical protein AVL59_15740 [Streptomyces griseochromogenes]
MRAARFGPFATPRSPFGTVLRKLKSALSDGRSLHGKTVCAEFGRGQIAKPSGVGTRAVCARARRGSAEYSTRTVTTRSSSSARVVRILRAAASTHRAVAS